jgi:molecular chaperone DnaJ
MTPDIHFKFSRNLDECREILGVDENCTRKEIKQAYRKLSLKYHPDRNLEFKDGKKFKEISEAYQVLKSHRKKSFKKQEKSPEEAHSAFWKYQGEKMGDEMRFNFESFAKKGFGGDFNQETHNREKPISQKSTHFILYGGLALVAVWIILFEIIKP